MESIFHGSKAPFFKNLDFFIAIFHFLDQKTQYFRFSLKIWEYLFSKHRNFDSKVSQEAIFLGPMALKKSVQLEIWTFSQSCQPTKSIHFQQRLTLPNANGCCLTPPLMLPDATKCCWKPDATECCSAPPLVLSLCIHKRMHTYIQ